MRNALAKRLSPSYGREIDPNSEILVTSGANVGMYSFLAAFLNEGDEVIVPAPHLCVTFYEAMLEVLLLSTEFLRTQRSVHLEHHIPRRQARLRALPPTCGSQPLERVVGRLEARH